MLMDSIFSTFFQRSLPKGNAHRIKRSSIKKKVLIPFIVFVILMIAVNSILVINSLKYNDTYNNLISNITEANSISGVLKKPLDAELYNILAGKLKFKDGKQFKIIKNANQKLYKIELNITSDDSSIKFELVKRTMTSIEELVTKFGKQIDEGKSINENTKLLEDIRYATTLLEGNIQDYINC
jgi:two-component system sensor histidine kinase YesM